VGLAIDPQNRVLVSESDGNKVRLIPMTGLGTAASFVYGIQNVQYVRLTATAKLQVSQIIVLNTAGVNVALTAICSSGSTTATVSDSSKLVVDGFYGCKERVFSAAAGSYIQLNLGSAQEIAAVIVYPRLDTYLYNIQDCNSYTVDLYNSTNTNSLKSANVAGLAKTSIAPPIVFDYRIKTSQTKSNTDIFGTFRNGSTRSQYIRFLRVFSATGPLQIAQVVAISVETGVNLALGKTVVASTPGLANITAVTDGLAYQKPAASSYSDSRAGGWIEVDLGAEYLIESVYVWPPAGVQQSYTIHGYSEKRFSYNIANS
jgi:hypothetical protein